MGATLSRCLRFFATVEDEEEGSYDFYRPFNRGYDHFRPSSRQRNALSIPGVRVYIYCWANGFSVGDGPLRTVSTMRDVIFLDEAMEGNIPSELQMMFPDRYVDLRVVHYLDTPFPLETPDQREGVSGEELDREEPEYDSVASLGEADAQRMAQSMVQLVLDVPPTAIRIWLPNGTSVTGVFSPRHPMLEVRQFLLNARRELRGAHFHLMSRMPYEVIDEERSVVGSYSCIFVEECA